MKIATQTPKHRAHGTRHVGGFTLIELMIAVMVVAILMAIAYPSYQNHVIKTRRAAAAACSLEVAGFMERYYTTNLRYDNAGAAPALPSMQCVRDLSVYYNIGLANVTATTYSVQAAPRGQQASRDTRCATLAINQTGTKSVTGAATNVSECW